MLDQKWYVHMQNQNTNTIKVKGNYNKLCVVAELPCN